jgi:indolepyruvate ferredoxin oxidoreductase, beta subunit
VNYDFVLCGVGGQGVLSVAWVIGQAAQEAGLYLKQPEVHGMAQRGGAVSALVRLSDVPIASDLIAEGTASMVLSVEPMESLRYTKLLAPEGWIVTEVAPLINTSTYPEPDALYGVLFSAPRVLAVNATPLAQKAGTVKAQNTVMLGAAASRLPIPTELLEKHVAALFEAKGPRYVTANVKAFRMGRAAAQCHEALLAHGVAPEAASRAVAGFDFAPEPMPADEIARWAARLAAAGGLDAARKVFAERAAA